MPRYQIHLKAELNNVTNLTPKQPDEYEWKFKFQCTKCREAHNGEVSIFGSEVVEIPGSRGEANLVMRCKFCQSEGIINLELPTLKPYTIDDSSRFAPLIVLEGRGWEPTSFIPTDGFKAVGVESGTVFDDIDLTELEWVDYDEKAAESVEIMDIESKVTKA